MHELCSLCHATCATQHVECDTMSNVQHVECCEHRRVEVRRRVRVRHDRPRLAQLHRGKVHPTFNIAQHANSSSNLRHDMPDAPSQLAAQRNRQPTKLSQRNSADWSQLSSSIDGCLSWCSTVGTVAPVEHCCTQCTAAMPRQGKAAYLSTVDS